MFGMNRRKTDVDQVKTKTDVVGMRVEIRLLDPDCGRGIANYDKIVWPVLTGTMHSKGEKETGGAWYFAKLENPIPAGFNPCRCSLDPGVLPELVKKPRFELILIGHDHQDTFLNNMYVDSEAGVLVALPFKCERLPRIIPDDFIPKQAMILCGARVTFL